MADTTEVEILQYVAAPFFKCIYCGAEDNLSSEHAIPYGLLGRVVLPKASCERCRTATHAFETHCLERMFGPARYRLGIPSRKSHKRRSQHPTLIEKHGGERVVETLPTEWVPRAISIPTLSMPKILTGATDDDLGVMWSRIDARDMDQIAERYKAAKIVTQFSLLAFVRMLAKIAHCTAHTILSAEQIIQYELFLPHLICAGGGDPLYFVGGAGVPNRSTHLAHELDLCTLTQETRELLLVRIRLFAFMQAPEHVVVVGQRDLN